jgi:hypothetical protein
MTPYEQALAAASPRRVETAVSSAAASALLGEFGEVAELESLYDTGTLTVSETDTMCFAEAAVVEAAREVEAAAAEVADARAQLAAAHGRDAAEAAREQLAAAQARAAAAAAKLSQAIADAAGVCAAMRHGLVTRHGGVQESADAAGVLAGPRFHGQ